MLEFFLFFFGMPLAITLLCNYCERQKKRKARLKRIEQERISETKIAQIAEHQRELKRQHERLVREQIELAKQQAREEMERKREDERLAKEQEKQAEQLAKHEKRLADLEERMAVAEEEIEFQSQQIERLRAHIEHAETERDACVYGSTRYYQWDKKCLALEKQIHTAESKMAKAQYIKASADKELAA